MEAHDPLNPLPERINDERRRQLNDALTLAVGQGRLDLTEFSELSDAVWSITEPARFTRLEELIGGRTGPQGFADLEKLAEKAAPPSSADPSPSIPATRGLVPSLSGAINSLGTGSAQVPAVVPTQSSWFGDIERSGSVRLAEHEGFSLLFGDLTLDLRDATLTSPVSYLQVTSVFGDIRLIVPPGIQVENRMSLAFGDSSLNQAPQPAPGAPTVILLGRAIFGDLRITVAEPGAALRRGWREWIGW